MSVIDDITAILTPVLHTNTTKDITAAAVKTALISAFTDVVNDEIARATATEAEVTSAVAAVPAVARGAEPIYQDILATTGFRTGQIHFDVQNWMVTGNYGTLPDKILDGAGAITANAWLGVTDYIMVISGSELTVANPGGFNFPMVWYDADKTVISYTTGPWTHGQVITVPDGAFFLRWTLQYYGTAPNAHACQLIQGNIPTSSIRHKWKSFPSTVSMHRPWTGRCWMLAGDSMGAGVGGNSWFADVAQYHGCSSIRNQAKSGGYSVTMMDKWNRPTDFTRVPLTSGDFAGIDAVITQVGYNDAHFFLTPIGTITDSLTSGTFIGNMKNFVELVLTSNHNIKLILGTPTGDQSTDFTHGEILPYRQAIRDICELYSLACWDVGRTSQMSRLTGSFYSTDNLHPTHDFPFYDGVHSPSATGIGSKMVFGSNLAAFMHTVFPSDWTGDPVWSEEYIIYDALGNST